MADEEAQRRRLVRGYDRARFHEAARRAFALEDARGRVPEGVPTTGITDDGLRYRMLFGVGERDND